MPFLFELSFSIGNCGAKCAGALQCAIFSAVYRWDALGWAEGVANASRRASEATTTGLAPKYRKIRPIGLLRGFLPENAPFAAEKSKTSDFFEGNIRTFCMKVPYFCLEKSDVFASKTRFFHASCPILGLISGKNAGRLPCSRFKRMEIM